MVFRFKKKKKKEGVSISSIRAGPTQSIGEGMQQQFDQRARDKAKKFTPRKDKAGRAIEKIINLPIGIGTTIKTLSTGFGTLIGQREEHEKTLGKVTGGDIATTALTLGTLGTGASAIGTGIKSAKAAKAASISFGAGRTATITKTATALNLEKTTLTTQRAFIGKAPRIGLEKIFNASKRTIARRFMSNGKSQLLTSSLLQKIGLSATAAGTALTIFGTYPFAGFIKEEALQTSSLAFKTAFWNKDQEGMANAINQQEELLDSSITKKIISIIPFLNIQKEIFSYFKSARVQVENQKRALENF
ncbi:MAG: hypothetical protein GWP19_00955 [Planctomycetia bacterium]|nr:hypothetical protein [Planctomycetia bacterium]